MVIKMILDRLWDLKNIGVSMIVVGHTKRKTVTDIVTDDTFEMLTTNMQENYFNAIKTKLHFLGVASVNREIELTKKKQRMGGDKEVGKVIGESRVITFRDDNFNIDSKSRFKEIRNQITLDAQELIDTMKEAIELEQKKDGTSKSLEEVAKDQAKEFEIKEAEQLVIKNKELEELEKEELINIDKNKELIKELMVVYNSKDDDAKKEMVKFMKDNEISLKAPETTPTESYENLLSKFK